MIPKIIHYCWLSDEPLPDTIKNYIESWKRNLPDYQIKRWSYKNFPRGKSKWVDDAFDAKKYAFAADYIRCYALFNEGGIYLDSDVEVLKSFNSLLHLPYFIGRESDGSWEAAILGSKKKNELFGEMLKYYDSHSFNDKDRYDTTPMPKIIKEIGERLSKVRYIGNLEEFNLTSSELQILPADYFSPKSYKNGEIKLTNRTYTIHHFTASWHGKKEKLYKLVSKLFGSNITKFISRTIKVITHKNCHY